MRSFDQLLVEAEESDVAGWGFGWLAGRATEERPPWGYALQLAERLGSVTSALDIDTGGGEVVAEAQHLPSNMVVTEGWPANADRARRLLEPRGVRVVEVVAGAPLPFVDNSFELVTARHPVSTNWSEIHRVLVDGGHYFAQHVGPASAFELIEWFVGPMSGYRDGRDPDHEIEEAQRAGLVIEELRTARCRMEFYDIGAVVWILRKCVWWVPDFSVKKYRDRLVALDAQMRCGEPFVAHSTRHLINARR